MKKQGSKKIRLLLVDDHPIVREGLKAALSTRKNIEVVGEASGGEEAVKKAGKLRPDVILMDLSMPGMGGLEASRKICRADPHAKVIALTMHENREYIVEMSRIGARGYVLKDSPPSELIDAIETVHAGEIFFSPRASQQLLKSFVTNEAPVRKSKRAKLAPRERDILCLVSDGLKNAEIAARMGVTDRTVETYRRRIMMKLGVHSVAELVRYAIANGLVKVE